jgi:hypothetical protein
MTTQTVTLEQAVKEASAAMLAVLEAYGFDAEEYDHDHGIG